MKKVLLATTALVMTTGYAAAEVSFSGKASAGISSSSTTTAAAAATTTSGNFTYYDASGDAIVEVADGTAAVTLATGDIVLGGTNGAAATAASSTDSSEVFSGIDLNVSASVTTDNGITITVADDFGGGMIADYNDDYAVEAQTSDLDTPGVTISGNGVSLTVDNQAIDDRYDDSQNGDIGLTMNFAGNDIGITLDTDAAAGEASMSYSIGGAAGAVSYGLVGTDANDNGASAYKWNVGYDMNGMSLTFKSDKVDDVDAINTFGITAPLGAMSVSISADDNEDWDASVSYSAGALGFSYATDEESAWDSNATYSLGGGATAYVGANSAEFSVAGVEFTF